jgi:aldehyde dehydrogenase (NAD+)
MSLSTLQRIFNKQKAFFYSHETFNPDYRKIHLKALLNVIDKNYEQIVHALKVDLNKSEAESYISEILLVRNEIKTMIKNINR